MTLDQFYDELRKVTEGGVPWHVLNGFIEPVPSCSCPWLQVHGSGNMSHEDCKALWHAADKTSGHDSAIRAELLECCGLEERA